MRLKKWRKQETEWIKILIRLAEFAQGTPYPLPCGILRDVELRGDVPGTQLFLNAKAQNLTLLLAELPHGPTHQRTGLS